MKNVLSIHRRILHLADLKPCEFNAFFPRLKKAVMTNRVRKNWKPEALFSRIEKKAAHRCYSNTKTSTPLGVRVGDNQYNSETHNCLDDSISSQTNRSCHYNNALKHYNCLVIGSGPAGLRTAIELQLLGSNRVVVVEKRSRFSRNNVLHLWPFVIDDLKSLGAKKFYGKFCAGSIDHISIRQLQLILLKICLMIGCDFRESCSYLHLCPQTIKQTANNSNATNSDKRQQANQVNYCTESVYKESNGNSSDCLKSIEPVKVPEQEDNTSSELKVSLTDKEQQQQPAGDENAKLANQDSHVSDNKNQNHGEPVETKDKSILTDEKSELKQTSDKVVEQEKRGENLRGTRAHFECDNIEQEKELHNYEWDVVVGADGRRNTLSTFFPRKEFRGRLAIAITANFINRQTPAEASVSEISGLSFIYNQEMFNSLAYDTNIQLENICYYKDDTHYFVMTAKKKSLLERGVLISDYATTQDLLSEENVDRQALLQYAKDAAYWTTGLEPLDFALNHYGQEDCAMFDFTSMYAASNACKALRTQSGGLTLVSLVGDSLLEPFWPTGSGCARGFLSSFDAAWMCRQWAVNRCATIDYHNSNSSRSSRNPNESHHQRSPQPTTYNKMALSVMAERESIYRILAQTTSENLHQNYSLWTLNPHSRYPNLNRHLVIPSQVEHLMDDYESRAHGGLKNRLSITPNESSGKAKTRNNPNQRRSPKKLKSANSSPLAQPRSYKGRSKSLSKNKSPSHGEFKMDETYLEFEASYNDLPERGNSRRRPDCDIHDDLFIPSISGTLPSSNNLLSLEARRARDIDECLRQRRQKTQLHVVRDRLIGQFRDEDGRSKRHGSVPNTPIIPGGPALIGELRRLREKQQVGDGKENKLNKDLGGPLTLLNSIRRCASFAERVKNFENKLCSSTQEGNTNVPKSPVIDNVKNLPQFATLNELFIRNSNLSNDTIESPNKIKIPIMKLSKDDWNVKCWERKLNSWKSQNGRNLVGSTKSLNKAGLSENYHELIMEKPEKQVEIFKHRIREMAEKLDKKPRNGPNVDSEQKTKYGTPNKSHKQNGLLPQSQGWVNHLKRELVKGSEFRKVSDSERKPINPNLPKKHIKKLFEDDDDDDGIDINKHYDHLCINRPTNKYLSKNSYTSHLIRTKYDSSKSKVIQRNPTTASKQAHIAYLTSRGSSASSTISDCSTNTAISSSSINPVSRTQLEYQCFRCKSVIEHSDKITIGDSVLHRSCLSCSSCQITLRTNEVQYHLKNLRSVDGQKDAPIEFNCSICKPSIRVDLNREAAERLASSESRWSCTQSEDVDYQQVHMRSREEFLNEKINYNELYKNILKDSADVKNTERNERQTSSGSRKSPSSTRRNSSKVLADSGDLHVDNEEKVAISPTPISFTLPMKLITRKPERESDKSHAENEPGKSYRVARSETVDGSEQVTLVLPPSSDRPTKAVGDGGKTSPGVSSAKSKPKTLIDEEELQRILHLDTSTASKTLRQQSDKDKSGNDSSNDDKDEDDTSDDNPTGDDAGSAEVSDDPSSLNSPADTDESNDDDDDNEDENIDQNSTYDDFLTSEEFGASSERENELEDDEDDDQRIRLESSKLSKLSIAESSTNG